jgi:outer membrane protein TolC
VPIYQGGGEYSTIRQSKETVGQQRLNLDINRDQARATVVQSWGQLDAAKAQIEATTAQVNAAEIALNGVREEARVGQRTYRCDYNDGRCSRREQSERQAACVFGGEGQIKVTEVCRPLGRRREFFPVPAFV